MILRFKDVVPLLKLAFRLRQLEKSVGKFPQSQKRHSISYHLIFLTKYFDISGRSEMIFPSESLIKFPVRSFPGLVDTPNAICDFDDIFVISWISALRFLRKRTQVLVFVNGLNITPREANGADHLSSLQNEPPHSLISVIL